MKFARRGNREKRSTWRGPPAAPPHGHQGPNIGVNDRTASPCTQGGLQGSRAPSGEWGGVAWWSSGVSQRQRLFEGFRVQGAGVLGCQGEALDWARAKQPPSRKVSTSTAPAQSNLTMSSKHTVLIGFRHEPNMPERVSVIQSARDINILRLPAPAA